MVFFVHTSDDPKPRPISTLIGAEISRSITLPDVGAVQRVAASPGETGEITRLDNHITFHRSGRPLLHSWHEGRPLAAMRMRGGLLHVRPAHVTHKSVWDAHCALTIIALSPRFIAQCAADLFKRDLVRVSLRPSIGGFDPFLWRLGVRLDELTQTPEPPLVFMDEIATTMAMHLLLTAGAEPVAKISRALPFAAVRRVSDYVDAHLAHQLRLADLAALCDLSPYHFARQFKRETGFTPARFIRSRRMREASRLLSETNLSIDDITVAVGYQDPSAFRRAFIRERGSPPSRFRGGEPA